MSAKKLLILVVAVFVLLGLVFVKKAVLNKQISRQEAEQVSEFTLIKDLPESFISRVVVYKGSDEKNKLRIAKNNEGLWVLEDKFAVRAKKETVDNFLKGLKNLSGEIRAESREVFGDFQIEDAKGLHIVLESEAGKVLKHLVISFLQPEWGKSFVRLFDSQKIVLVSKNIPAMLLGAYYNKDAALDGKSLMDLKLFSFEAGQMRKIRMDIKGSDPLELVKNDLGKGVMGWNFAAPAAGEEFDAAKVDELFRNISNILVKDAVDPKAGPYGFDNSDVKLIVEDGQKVKVVEMEVGSRIDSEKVWYVKALPSGSVFKIAESYIQNIKKDRKFFIKVVSPSEKAQP